MSEPIKFTGTANVWTTSHWRNIDHVHHLIKEGELEEAVSELTYLNHDMSETDGWCEVGVATITVTFHPREDILAKELKGLQAQLQNVRAENHQRENAILDRISKLQALEFTA